MNRKTWLTCCLALLPLLLVFFVLNGCKKGAAGPATSPAGNQFATDAGSGKAFATQGPGSGNTFAGSTQGTPVPPPDDDDDDDEPPPPALTSSLEIGSTTFTNQTVSCGSGSGFYAMSVNNSAASFTVTLYFGAKPASSGSYTIEEVGTGAPAAGKVWCVYWQGSNTFTAASGYVYVSVSGNVVTASFSDVEVTDGVNSEYLSGLLHCQ